MAGKHAPIELGKYLEIHQTAMRALERSGCILPGGDGLAIEVGNPGRLLIEGRIRCVGGMAVEVTKVLAVLGDEGDRAPARTIAYTYHVLLEGFGNVLRYCGPHDDEAHPDHKPFHHKHAYDVLHG